MKNKGRVIQMGEGSGKEIGKDRRTILREKKAVEVRKTVGEEETLREVIVKIELGRINT